MITNGGILITGGRVIDPRSGLDGIRDVLLTGGKIAAVGTNLKPAENCKHINAKDKIVVPGLVDIHVHLREPGGEAKETIKTGTQAAALGGVTTVVSMPNTDPPMDNVSEIQFVLAKANQEGVVRVCPTGTVTKNRAGRELAEIGAMARCGCVAITDDGSPVANAQLLRRALEYARIFGIAVVQHCEDNSLSANGVMNEGSLSTRLGLPGIPRQAEYTMVLRDIALAKLTGGHLHIAHVSVRESVEAIRLAKKNGINVTADTAPHYFTLTESAVAEYSTLAKVNPPLRLADDLTAIKEGLADGSIDAIASDHAPHTKAEKDQNFTDAPFGMIGLETLLPLTMDLYREGIIDLKTAILKLTLAPANVMGLDKTGSLEPGARADVTIFDLNKNWTAMRFASRSQNSPFCNRTLKSKVETVITGGKIVVENGKLMAEAYENAQ